MSDFTCKHCGSGYGGHLATCITNNAEYQRVCSQLAAAQAERKRLKRACDLYSEAEILLAGKTQADKELAVAMALREVKALLMKLHDTYDRPTSYIERQVLLTWIAKVTYLTSAATLAKLVELERDAGLYRKLRKSHWSDSPDALCVTTSKAVKLGYDTYSGELLDAAIDNAKEGK